jgi:hypothetical protein
MVQYSTWLIANQRERVFTVKTRRVSANINKYRPNINPIT